MKNNIGLFLSKRAHLSPGLEAYVDSESGERYSYPELNARSNRTANALRKIGVSKGDRVARVVHRYAPYGATQDEKIYGWTKRFGQKPDCYSSTLGPLAPLHHNRHC